jgi:hypothetical protein
MAPKLDLLGEQSLARFAIAGRLVGPGLARRLGELGGGDKGVGHRQLLTWIRVNGGERGGLHGSPRFAIAE